MRLKTFTAHSMREAMQMVRKALGEDAIIIATREDNGGRTVRVTAAIEKDMDAMYSDQRPLTGQKSQSHPSEDWLFGDDDGDEAGVVEEITEVMLRHATPEEVTEAMISYSAVMGLDDPRTAMLEALRSLFQFRPLPVKRADKPVMLVGPPGSGKTLAAAKLAARGVMSGMDVAVITTDTVRAGGIEQLEAFTRLLEIRLNQAETSGQLKECLMKVRDADQIIIDTAGVNPFGPESMKSLAKLMGSNTVEPVLVLPAGIDAEESGDVAKIFTQVGVTSLLPSRVDTARRLGGLLSAAHQGNLAFTDMSNTPKVADGLTPLNAKRLTQILMPQLEGKSMSQPRFSEGRS